MAQGSQKGTTKPPKMEPLVTQNLKNTRKTNTQKKTLKKWCKKYQKWLKKGLPLSRRRGHQNHNNPNFGLKMSPKPPGGVPGNQNTQKSSKNEPLGLQNHSKSWQSGNPKSRNQASKITQKTRGTVAGYARSALDIISNIQYLIHNI